jgi:DUF2075 family protein
LQHNFFFDGNSKKIAWVIHTKNNFIEQQRNHADIYLDKVTNLQSKYIALHVGLFWGIGRFIIRDEDSVTVNLDESQMDDHLSGKIEVMDEFIKNRTKFIKNLIEQRKLKINFVLKQEENNLASKLIQGKGA